MGKHAVVLHKAVEQIVTGLGYELVEIERFAGGLLRVTIDLPWCAPPAAQEAAAPVAQATDCALQATAPAPLAQRRQFVTLEDCEKVTRQLQFALAVDALDYRRLEVASPGIDRPLRSERDLLRFAGSVIDVTFKNPPADAAAPGGPNGKRKKFRGLLRRAAPGGWEIVWSDAPPPSRPGHRVGKKRAPAATHQLGFAFDELRDARLAPLVDFKGRAARTEPPP